MRFVIRLLVNAAAIWVAAQLIDGVHMPLPDDMMQAGIYLGVVAAVFTVVNLLLRPILKLISLPVILLTLGLFSFVVNTALLVLTGEISTRLGYGLYFDSFWWALAASLVISFVSWILSVVIPREEKKRK